MKINLNKLKETVIPGTCFTLEVQFPEILALIEDLERAKKALEVISERDHWEYESYSLPVLFKNRKPIFDVAKQALSEMKTE